ncbi:MAG: TrmH family RNA methyltransferase [Anaerolineales bacterium]
MISSGDNPKIKLTRALLSQNKARARHNLAALEGTRLIQDVLHQGYKPEFVLYRGETPPEWLSEVLALGVAPKIFDALADTDNSQGVLGVFPQPQPPTAPHGSLWLALDGLRDPGNMGTILRTAAAAGADGALLLPGCVDPWNPKAVRAGMGAHFRVPLWLLGWDDFAAAFAGDWAVWVADAAAPKAQPYSQANLTRATVLMIGSEAHGVSHQARQQATGALMIPMARGVESLNSASAAAVLLFEAQRQRALG